MENDYYAAVDDCDNTSGAGMIGETGYLSATLYRYACVDVNLLNRNLGYDKEAVRLALSTFLNAFALSLPSGKQNSFGPLVHRNRNPHRPPHQPRGSLREAGQY